MIGLDMLELAFGTGCVVLALFAGLWGAWRDLVRMTIPNNMSLAIVLLWACTALVQEPFAMKATHHLAGAAVVFIVTFIMYTYGVMGAGDSKLMTAYALWIPYMSYTYYFFAMGVAGFVFVVVACLWQKWGKHQDGWHKDNWFNQLKRGKRVLPYGAAITAGAWCVILPMLWSKVF